MFWILNLSVLISHTRVFQDVIVEENWIKGTLYLSVLFTTTEYEFTKVLKEKV